MRCKRIFPWSFTRFLDKKNVAIFYIVSFFPFLKDLFRERERTHEWGEGQRERRIIQADSPLSSEPDAELHLMTLRLWQEPKSRVGHLHDWATQESLFSICFQRKQIFTCFFFLLNSSSILKLVHSLLLFFIVATYSLTKASQRPMSSKADFTNFLPSFKIDI